MVTLQEAVLLKDIDSVLSLFIFPIPDLPSFFSQPLSSPVPSLHQPLMTILFPLLSKIKHPPLDFPCYLASLGL